MSVDFQVFIGWDARERAAWQVCAASLFAHAQMPPAVQAISRDHLGGLYTRPTSLKNGRSWDEISGEPMSTAFSLARFWVPFVAGRTGWALFCDGDFLWRADVHELLDLADPSKAVMVVPNRHQPVEREKMDGQAQTVYHRKNWSSLMLWNLAHAGTRRLTLHALNAWHKHDLHGFRWLAEIEIGFLPEEWNHLVGVGSLARNSLSLGERPGEGGERAGGEGEPKAVHFTLGTPDMPGYEHSEYADEWRSYLRSSLSRNSLSLRERPGEGGERVGVRAAA